MIKRVAHVISLVLLFAVALNAVQPIFGTSNGSKSEASLILEEIETLETQNSEVSCHLLLPYSIISSSKGNVELSNGRGSGINLTSSPLECFTHTPRYIFYHSLKLYC